MQARRRGAAGLHIVRRQKWIVCRRADRSRRVCTSSPGRCGASVGGVLVAGIDLAASPRNTAVAVLDGLAIVDLATDVDDDGLVRRTDGAVKIGLDCPLGWPVAFVEFVASLVVGRDIAAAGTIAERDRLAYRDTDRWVREHHPPLRPLSVSADRIAHAAFRAAALFPRLDPSIDRSGYGRVVEAYPSGSLRAWDLPFRGYKSSSENDSHKLRITIVDELERVADLGRFRARALASDHALDAVVAALTAVAAATGRATLPAPEHLDAAQLEGWIAIPTCTLDALADQRA